MNLCSRLSVRCIVVITAVSFACGDDSDDSDTTSESTTEAVCDGGVPAYDVTVESSLTEIGPTSNDIVAADGAVWIVESGSNSVSRLRVGADALDDKFVDVGTERNPYALAIDESAGELWITNFATDTVSVAAIDTGEVVDEIDDDAFADPSAVALVDDYAYVANVDFRGRAEGYGPGTIAVVDRNLREVISEVKTQFQNPHFLSAESIDGDAVLLASGGGAIELDPDGVRTTTEGGLEWFDIADDPVEPPGHHYALGQADVETVGAPGKALLTPEGNRLYFASGIAPAVFAFDVDERTWMYDAADPLVLYDTDDDVTHRAAMGPDGLLWITAFNDDQLYLVDTTCDEAVADPIDLGESPDMLDGTQAVAVVEDADRLVGYILSSLANALSRVQLEPKP